MLEGFLRARDSWGGRRGGNSTLPFSEKGGKRVKKAVSRAEQKKAQPVSLSCQD